MGKAYMHKIEFEKKKNCCCVMDKSILHAHPECILGKISKETESERWCLLRVCLFVCLLLIRLEESK